MIVTIVIPENYHLLRSVVGPWRESVLGRTRMFSECQHAGQRQQYAGLGFLCGPWYKNKRPPFLTTVYGKRRSWNH